MDQLEEPLSAATTFIHISDLHLAPRGHLINGFDPTQQMRLVIDRIRELEVTPDFLVVSGDLTDDGSRESYGIARAYDRMVMPHSIVSGP